MAHLLIVELPGGNDVDIMRAAIERGDTFSFLTADLAHYQRQPLVSAVLEMAQRIISLPGFDYDEVQGEVLALHKRWPIEALLCLVDKRLLDAARLAQALGLPHIRPETARLLRDPAALHHHLAEQGLDQAEAAPATRAAMLSHPLQQLQLQRHGQLIGCDTFSVNGRHHLLGVNEKQSFAPPYAPSASVAIRGGCFTPNQGQYAEIERFVFARLDALGFDWGAAHTELMLTEAGLRLITVNGRLVGAKLPRLLSYALGYSVHEALVDVHLGQWLAAALAQDQARPMQVAVVRWLAAAHEGELRRVDLPEQATALFPGLRCVEMLKRSGDALRPPQENADRIGYVMVSAATRLDAERVAERYLAASRIVMADEVPDPFDMAGAEPSWTSAAPGRLLQ